MSSTKRQEMIKTEILNCVIPSDVCGTVENLGRVITKYKLEVDEERVVQCVMTSVFRKYCALRDTAKETRGKLEQERTERGKDVSLLIKDATDLTNENSTLKVRIENLEMAQRIAGKAKKALTEKIQELEMELKRERQSKWIEQAKPNNIASKKRMMMSTQIVDETEPEVFDPKRGIFGKNMETLSEIEKPEYFYRDTCQQSNEGDDEASS
jgi:hypothetical protein